MRTVTAFDTETSLIRPGCLAPPLACLTWQHAHDDAPSGLPSLFSHTDERLLPLVRGWLEDCIAGRRVLVGHNIAFDFAVLCEAFPELVPLVFAAYDADAITDTMIRAWLLDNAAGILRGRIAQGNTWRARKYDLESVCKDASGRRLKKDAWRLSYGEFLGVPLEQWPVRAVEVQHAASLLLPVRVALLERLQSTPKSKQPKGTQRAVTALKKEIEGLREMLEGDASRAQEYPLEDATATLEVYCSQERHVSFLRDQYRQSRAYFALYLQSCWGLRTDELGVEILRRETQAELDEAVEELIAGGLLRANGSRDTKAAKARMIEVCKRAGIPVIRADGHVNPDKPCPSQCSCGKVNCRDLGRKAGHKDIYEAFDHPEYCTEHVSLDKDACERIAEFDPLLWRYSEATTLAKVLTNDLEALAGGIIYPVHTRYGFAATGRTTSSKPNIQNQSKRDGIREAFVARPCYVFIEADFPQLELYTLAQCCVTWFGHSKLADTLLAGKDPHTMFAASILRISYDDCAAILKDESHPKHAIAKKTRQQCKPGNFGFAGGMGAETFLATTRKQLGRKAFAELDLDLERAKLLKKQWMEAWPEMRLYFARVEELCSATDNGKSTVEGLFTGLVRGNATYCGVANHGFQALGAACAKQAVWEVAKASYAQPQSPLFGCRPNAFVHDEIIGECPYCPNEFGVDLKAHAAANELARLMVVGANKFLPDVPIALERMEPVMMLRWYKAATSLFRDEEGQVHTKPGAGRVLVPAKAIKDENKKTKVVVDMSFAGRHANAVVLEKVAA